MFVDGNVKVGVFPVGEKGPVSSERAGGVGVSAHLCVEREASSEVLGQ
jgi:hypothetical protein